MDNHDYIDVNFNYNEKKTPIEMYKYSDLHGVNDTYTIRMYVVMWVV